MVVHVAAAMKGLQGDVEIIEKLNDIVNEKKPHYQKKHQQKERHYQKKTSTKIEFIIRTRFENHFQRSKKLPTKQYNNNTVDVYHILQYFPTRYGKLSF